MGVKKCCVSTCLSSAARVEDHGVTFHKFPKDTEILKRWYKVTQCNDQHEHSSIQYVCSRHFRKVDFEPFRDSKYMLRSGAIPSIFPWGMSDITESKETILTTMDEVTNDSVIQPKIEDDSTLNDKIPKESNVETIESVSPEIKKEIVDEPVQSVITDVYNATKLPHVTEPDLFDVIQSKQIKENITDIHNETPSTSQLSVTMNSDVNLPSFGSSINVVLNQTTPKKRGRKRKYPLIIKEEPTHLKVNSMAMSAGSRVEAKDFGDLWHPAQIVEVDDDEMEVLVRFADQPQRHDEWISVSSPRLRPLGEVGGMEARSSDQPTPIVYKVGERCLARWKGNRRYQAIVQKVLDDGKYEIIFDDNFVSICHWSQLYKVKDSAKAPFDSSCSNVSLAVSPIPYGAQAELNPVLNASTSPMPVPFHKHLFDPSRDYLGSKSERRQMKRKLDVKDLFNIGKRKKNTKCDMPINDDALPKKKRGRKPKLSIMEDVEIIKAANVVEEITDVKEEIDDVNDSTELPSMNAETDTNILAQEDITPKMSVQEDLPLKKKRGRPKFAVNDDVEITNSVEVKEEMLDSKDSTELQSMTAENNDNDVVVDSHIMFKEEIKESVGVDNVATTVSRNDPTNEVTNVTIKSSCAVFKDKTTTVVNNVMPSVEGNLDVLDVKEEPNTEALYNISAQRKEELLQTTKTENEARDTKDDISIADNIVKLESMGKTENEVILKSPKLILKRSRNDTWNKTLKDVETGVEALKQGIQPIEKAVSESKSNLLTKTAKVMIEKTNIFDKSQHNLKKETSKGRKEKEPKQEALPEEVEKLKRQIMEKAAALELMKSKNKKKKTKKSKDKEDVSKLNKNTFQCSVHPINIIPANVSKTVGSTIDNKREVHEMDINQGLKLIADAAATHNAVSPKPVRDVCSEKFDPTSAAKLLKANQIATVESVLKELGPERWVCRWVNGDPDGVVSKLDPESYSNAPKNVVSLPRKSVRVEDKRLPPGWSKHMVRRSWGASSGKWDVVLVDSNNKRIRDKGDMRTYLANNADPELDKYFAVLNDFGVHRKLARMYGLDVVTDGEGLYQELTFPMGCYTSHANSPAKKKPASPGEQGSTSNKKKRHSIPPSPLASTPQSPTFDVAMSEANPLLGTSVLPLEDGYVYVGAIKVQIIDNLFRCPAEGCVKNFRKDNLLRMHIKHYHTKMRKMLGATPKVSDLAYARTAIPEDTNIPMLKCELPSAKFGRGTPKPLTPGERLTQVKSELNVETGFDTPTKSEPDRKSQQDSPKPRVGGEAPKRPKVLYPVKKTELKSEQSSPVTDEYQDDFECKIEEDSCDVKSEGGRYAEYEHLDFEAEISTHRVSKFFGKKSKDRNLLRKRQSMGQSDDNWDGSDMETRSSYGTPDSRSLDKKPDLMTQNAAQMMLDPNDSNFLISETGEKIKIVHMKREEIINCHCGFGEEDGLMIQCELCLCWQHAICHNIERESQVPEKYTCSICLNPRRGRRSRRFLHDQSWLYEGHLPGGAPDPALRRSHELTGNLYKIADALHTLRIKYHVATKKDHPKLYLWAKDWEDDNVNQQKVVAESLHTDFSDLNTMISDIDKENLPVKSEDMKEVSLGDIRTPPSEETDSQKEEPLGSQTLLANILSPGGASIDLQISTSELERLAKSVQETHEAAIPVRTAPEPEAAIESSVCRAHLLKHIQRCQALIDARLDSIEAQVAELESQDPSFEDDETAEMFPRTKQSIHMLLRDLDTMEELGNIT